MLFDPKIVDIFHKTVKYGELDGDNILITDTSDNVSGKLDQDKYANCFIESSSVIDDIYKAVTFYSQYLNYLRGKRGYTASVMPILDAEQVIDFQVHAVEKITKAMKNLKITGKTGTEKELYLYLISTDGLAQVECKEVLQRFNYIIQSGGKCGVHLMYIGSLSDIPTECKHNLHMFYLDQNQEKVGL